MKKRQRRRMRKTYINIELWGISSKQASRHRSRRLESFIFLWFLLLSHLLLPRVVFSLVLFCVCKQLVVFTSYSHTRNHNVLNFILYFFVSSTQIFVCGFSSLHTYFVFSVVQIQFYLCRVYFCFVTTKLVGWRERESQMNEENRR